MKSSFELLRRLTDAFEDHSGNRQCNHDDANQCSDVEETIHIGVRIFDIVVDVARAYRRLADEQLRNGDFDGIILLKDEALVYHQWVIAAKGYEDTIHALGKKGCEVRGSDQFLGCIRDAERNYERWRMEQERAMLLRATWMRASGLSEEEIKEHCNPEHYPADLAEEQKNIIAQAELVGARTLA